MSKKVKSIPCPECDGRGYTTSYSGSWHADNTLVSSYNDCRRCAGKGVILIDEVRRKDISEIRNTLREKQDELKQYRSEEIPRLKREIKLVKKTLMIVVSKCK
jgi:ribosomal protein L44E